MAEIDDVEDAIKRVDASIKTVDKFAELAQLLLEKESQKQVQSVRIEGNGIVGNVISLGSAFIAIVSLMCALGAKSDAQGIKADNNTAVIMLKEDLDKDSKRHDDTERDLKAWVDLHTKNIAELKAKQK